MKKSNKEKFVSTHFPAAEKVIKKMSGGNKGKTIKTNLDGIIDRLIILYKKVFGYKPSKDHIVFWLKLSDDDLVFTKLWYEELAIIEDKKENEICCCSR